MDGRQPSTRWYWAAGVLAVVGVIAGIVLAVGSYQAYQDDLEGLARSAGGEVRVSLRSDHDAVVFLEGPGVADNKDLRPKVVVTGPEGDQVAVQEYGAELLYDVPGRTGSTGRAIATFDVTVNGVYSVAVDAPAGTTIAVGGGLNVTTLARFVVALVVPALAVLLAIGMAVVVAIMRRSQPPVSTPPQRRGSQPASEHPRRSDTRNGGAALRCWAWCWPDTSRVAGHLTTLRPGAVESRVERGSEMDRRALWDRVVQWGATPAEVTGILPGDDLLPDGRALTNAIDIDAPPSAAVLPVLNATPAGGPSALLPVASEADPDGDCQEVVSMATKTLARSSLPPAAGPVSRAGATRVTVAVLGTLVGLAGVEHGIGEILQGRVVPEGLFIMSWPDAAAMEILSGEPALTVIPDLFVTGVLAVVAGLAVAAWSIWFASRRHGGLVLIGLSVLLLLVGGGIAPPVMGVVVGAVATRIHTAPRRPVGRTGGAGAALWPWFLAAAVVGYLALVPGVPIASLLGVASEAMVIGLAAFAFANLGLALWAARAQDRLQAASN